MKQQNDYNIYDEIQRESNRVKNRRKWRRLISLLLVVTLVSFNVLTDNSLLRWISAYDGTEQPVVVVTDAPVVTEEPVVVVTDAPVVTEEPAIIAEPETSDVVPNTTEPDVEQSAEPTPTNAPEATEQPSPTGADDAVVVDVNPDFLDELENEAQNKKNQMQRFNLS